jgi:methyl-accepting chemotaxis protein
MTARLLLHALPSDSAATDAAALAAAVGDLGALATVMVCATVVLVFVARGAFAYLTAREERLKAQPATARGNTPPAGTPSISVVHADLRALEERMRHLENKEASSSTAMAGMRDEMRRDMATLKEASSTQAEAIQSLTAAVTGLRAQLEWASRQSFGNPKTGG